MVSITNPTPFLHRHSNPTSPFSFPSILSFPFYRATSFHLRVSALRSDGDKIGSQESFGSNLLRKPVVSQSGKDLGGNSEKEEGSEGENEDEEGWIDWEDKILEDTVPLVGFVRMILHSGKYESGVRLSPEHERTILERLLPYHPDFEKKVGCGIDYITIGYHPDFESSRCLFIVRKDGELIDFSYWKCIKGLIRKNYPLYADSFILRHFQRHRRSGYVNDTFLISFYAGIVSDLHYGIGSRSCKVKRRKSRITEVMAVVSCIPMLILNWSCFHGCRRNDGNAEKSGLGDEEYATVN